MEGGLLPKRWNIPPRWIFMVYSRETKASWCHLALMSHNKCPYQFASSIVFGCLPPSFRTGSSYQNIKKLMIYVVWLSALCFIQCWFVFLWQIATYYSTIWSCFVCIWTEKSRTYYMLLLFLFVLLYFFVVFLFFIFFSFHLFFFIFIFLLLGIYQRDFYKYSRV